MQRAIPCVILIMGLACLLTGILLLVLRIADPDHAESLLFATTLPPEPTQGILLQTPLAPPPYQIAQVVPIMPVMPIADEATVTPAPTLPSQAPTATRTPPPTHTATVLPPPRETVASQTAHPTAIPTVIPFVTPTPTPSITPSATATFVPQTPDRILIPSIDLEAPIQAVWLQQIVIEGQVFSQWNVPTGRAVGWHETSAPIGAIGNTVLNGHHNTNGRVFGDLVAVEVGDAILIQGESGNERDYIVVQTMLLEEEGRSLTERQENARWLLPTDDERITLVTCWPPDGRSHRLVVIALPAEQVEEQTSHD